LFQTQQEHQPQQEGQQEAEVAQQPADESVAWYQSELAR